MSRPFVSFSGLPSNTMIVPNPKGPFFEVDFRGCGWANFLELASGHGVRPVWGIVGRMPGRVGLSPVNGVPKISELPVPGIGKLEAMFHP